MVKDYWDKDYSMLRLDFHKVTAVSLFAPWRKNSKHL